MKKILLLSGMTAVGLAAMAADVPEPQVYNDAYFYSMSANGQWAVSQTQAGIRIFNLATGHIDDYMTEDIYMYSCGIGKCISDNGIMVGSTDSMNPEYWKDGEWNVLEVTDDATDVSLCNAITADGSRICGSIGVGGISYDGDALMQAPCIWNAEGDAYGEPVMLPYPELDFTGRVPQYVTAVDISDDGKKVIGQVMNATGMISYPILYTENENGEWSYEIIHPELLMPEGMVYPEYPGDGPRMPQAEDYMTPEAKAKYDEAVQACIESGFMIPYPEAVDYLTETEKAQYEADLAEYEVKNEEWNNAFNAWFDLFNECIDKAPGYEFNSVRIAPDGKTFGCTIGKIDPENPFAWGYSFFNVWVFDIATGEITKYEQLNDLNLTYLGNDGVSLASTSLGNASNSYVLKDGKFETMYYWMSKQCPEYASWMNENMRFSYTVYEFDEETGEPIEIVKEDELMTGRAVGTPDLSKLGLTVQNIWDFMTEADGYIFDVKAGQVSGVESVRPAEDGEKVIYDLSGRILNDVTAPGIYIVNGEKKVVR